MDVYVWEQKCHGAPVAIRGQFTRVGFPRTVSIQQNSGWQAWQLAFYSLSRLRGLGLIF